MPHTIDRPRSGETASGDIPGTASLDSSRSGEGAKISGSTYSKSGGGPGPRVMSAGTLVGDEVINHEGEALGRIEEIMLDVPRGRIAYAVLSSGGFLGFGDKLFAIPWGALTLDTENKCMRLDIEKERFEQAPGFDKDHWPSMADETWAREIHSYYSADPYWD